jgi:hypothetical protein
MLDQTQTQPGDAPSGPLGKSRVHSGFLSHSVASFLIALLLLFITAPFIQELRSGRFIDGILMTVVLLSAILAVGGRHRSLAAGIVLAGPVLLARWIHHLEPGAGADLFFVCSFLVFLAFIVGQFLHFILRSPRVNSEVLCAAVSVYLLLGLIWTSAYVLLARMTAGAFSGLPAGSQPLHGFDALYFSFTTLTTVAYGDIVPATGPARMLAMLEAITGTMYVAVLVARLVSIYTSAGPPAAGEATSSSSPD